MSHSEPEHDLPDEAALTRALRDAGLAVDAAELHGALCGFVAGGGHAEGADWLQRLQVDDGRDDAGDAGAIAAMRAATLASFADGDCDLDLLLPDDEAPLADRVDALLAWCRGFLGGFGLAGAPGAALSAESSEALADFGRIAASEFGCNDSEEDEDAFAEIVEFVRVVPMLIHADCVGSAQRRRKAH